MQNKKDEISSSAVIEVSGGTYHGYDPKNSASENPGQNFVKEGYESVESDGVWVVSKKPNKSCTGVGNEIFSIVCTRLCKRVLYLLHPRSVSSGGYFCRCLSDATQYNKGVLKKVCKVESRERKKTLVLIHKKTATIFQKQIRNNIFRMRSFYRSQKDLQMDPRVHLSKDNQPFTRRKEAVTDIKYCIQVKIYLKLNV